VRTEPELHVRVVCNDGGRVYVVEDEHYQGDVIGTRQLKPDGSWTGWDSPCDIVDETWPIQLRAPAAVPGFKYPTLSKWQSSGTGTFVSTTSYPASGNYTQIFGNPTVTGTTGSSMITVSPGLLNTITNS
jgi:hypothetical protein